MAADENSPVGRAIQQGLTQLHQPESRHAIEVTDVSSGQRQVVSHADPRLEAVEHADLQAVAAKLRVDGARHHSGLTVEPQKAASQDTLDRRSAIEEIGSHPQLECSHRREPQTPLSSPTRDHRRALAPAAQEIDDEIGVGDERA